MLRQGQHDAAIPLIEAALNLARRLQELHLTGRLLSDRSYARDLSGDHAGGARDAAQSLRLYRQAGDQLQVGVMLGNLGNAELSTGDLDSARGHLHESLNIARALNDHYGVAYQTFNLGLAEYLSGALSTAEGYFAESLDLDRRMGMKAPMAYALIGLAMTGRKETDMGRSARLHGAADQALTALGHTIEPLEGRLRDLDCQRLRSAMGAEAFKAEYGAGRTLTSEQIIDLALGTWSPYRSLPCTSRQLRSAIDTTGHSEQSVLGNARLWCAGDHHLDAEDLAGVFQARRSCSSGTLSQVMRCGEVNQPRPACSPLGCELSGQGCPVR